MTQGICWKWEILQEIMKIHQYLLDRFYRLFIEVSSRALVYAEGYYKIEDDRNRGEIAQESLEEQIQMLAENQGEFESIASDLGTAISSISNIIGLAAPSTQNVCDGFRSTGEVANNFMDEVGTYEFAHAANDFAIMEGMMDSIESLIREYSGKAPAEVEKYQAGSIFTSEEVIALMEIEQVQTAWFAENGEDLRKAAEAYQNRINAALREEAGRQRLIKGVMIAAAAVVSAVVIVGSGGSATPAVAALWNAGVVTLAGTSAIYGVSEASEGLDDIRLGQAGDCVTVARNPVRDALPEDMQNIYYIAGEGSTIALALCTLGVGAVEVYGVSGMTGVVVEGGKIIVTAAGTHLIGEGLEELGMERSTVMLLEIGISVAIYGSLNKMQSAVENQQHVMVEVGSEGGTGALDIRNINGQRTSRYRQLTDDEISQLLDDIEALEADSSIFRFNEGNQTGFLDSEGIINVRGDVLPDLNSSHPRDLMSPRAVLAHEYYGHKHFDDVFGVRNPLPGSWNDEFRASYYAALNAPNLSDKDRMYLMLDALERAKEAGVNIKITDEIRRILYGY
ncbi:hypothetical protein HDR58_03990 [bacterium]|nr:hypothetical protein [bacterium]